MGYARRATRQEDEYDEKLIKSGRRGVFFSKRLSQEDLDAYLSKTGRVEKHRSMEEIHRDARTYKDELYKALHQK